MFSLLRKVRNSLNHLQQCVVTMVYFSGWILGKMVLIFSLLPVPITIVLGFAGDKKYDSWFMEM